MSDYKKGERVRVTIDAEVLDVDLNGDYSIGYPSGRGRWETAITDDSAAVTIERIAPEYAAGQVLRDKDGDLWMAVEREVDYDTDNVVNLTCATPKPWSHGAANDTIVQRYGPLIPVVIES